MKVSIVLLLVAVGVASTTAASVKALPQVAANRAQTAVESRNIEAIIDAIIGQVQAILDQIPGGGAIEEAILEKVRQVLPVLKTIRQFAPEQFHPTIDMLIEKLEGLLAGSAEARFSFTELVQKVMKFIQDAIDGIVNNEIAQDLIAKLMEFLNHPIYGPIARALIRKICDYIPFCPFDAMDVAYLKALPQVSANHAAVESRDISAVIDAVIAQIQAIIEQVQNIPGGEQISDFLLEKVRQALAFLRRVEAMVPPQFQQVIRDLIAKLEAIVGGVYKARLEKGIFDHLDWPELVELGLQAIIDGVLDHEYVQALIDRLEQFADSIPVVGGFIRQLIQKLKDFLHSKELVQYGIFDGFSFTELAKIVLKFIYDGVMDTEIAKALIERLKDFLSIPIIGDLAQGLIDRICNFIGFCPDVKDNRDLASIIATIKYILETIQNSAGNVMETVNTIAAHLEAVAAQLGPGAAEFIQNILAYVERLQGILGEYAAPLIAALMKILEALGGRKY